MSGRNRYWKWVERGGVIRVGEWMDQDEEVRLVEEGMDQYAEDMKEILDAEMEEELPYGDDD